MFTGFSAVMPQLPRLHFATVVPEQPHDAFCSITSPRTGLSQKAICNYSADDASYSILPSLASFLGALVKDGFWISLRAGSFVSTEVALEVF
jgi:hypothetical protein